MTNIRKSRSPKKRDKFLALDEDNDSIYLMHLVTCYPPDYDGDGVFVQRFRLSLGARALARKNPDRLRQLAHLAMRTGNCGHSYDCCGCWSSYVWKAKLVEGCREVLVFQRGSFNY
jgi:hypothetical protein